MKYHFILNTGIFETTRYFGIILERSNKKMTDPEGMFYGFDFYFHKWSLTLGVCIHFYSEDL